MTLFIAWFLLYHFGYSWLWFLTAFALWGVCTHIDESRLDKACYWLEKRIKFAVQKIKGKDDDEYQWDELDRA